MRIALVGIRDSDWRVIQRYVRKIALAVDSAKPGTYTEVDIPFR